MSASCVQLEKHVLALACGGLGLVVKWCLLKAANNRNLKLTVILHRFSVN